MVLTGGKYHVLGEVGEVFCSLLSRRRLLDLVAGHLEEGVLRLRQAGQPRAPRAPITS